MTSGDVPGMSLSAENDGIGADYRGPAGIAAGGYGEFDLRGKFDLLRRQTKLILATLLLIVAAALAISLALTPLYSATALVLVDPSRKNLLESQPQGASAASDNARIDSETEILRSDSVLMQVIAAAGLVADHEFGATAGLRYRLAAWLRLGKALPLSDAEANGRTLERLKSRLTVQRRGLTHLIAITVRSQDRQKAADIANGIAASYIAQQVQAKVAGIWAARDAVDEQIIRARRAVVDSETAFGNAIFDNVDRIVAVTGRGDIGQMRDDLDAMLSGRSSVAAQAESLRAGLNKGEWSAAGLASGAMQELELLRRQLRADVEGADRGSAAAMALQAELTQVEDDLDRAAREALGELQSFLAATDAALADARQALGTAILGSSLPPDILAQFYELQQVARNATSSYQALLSRLQELDTEAALQVADSRVVSAAIPPTAPSFPNIPLIIGLAGLFALGAGIGLAFLFENFVGGFTTLEQVEAVTRQRVGSVLPRVVMESGQSSVADAITAAPLSHYAEGVRRLRVMIDTAVCPARHDAKAGEGRVVMVSSALPGEGKTTVALSLARTYAVAGQRVLVLDCDLRKPSLHKHLNVEGSTGLVEVLSGHVLSRDLSRVLVADPKSPLASIVGARYSDLPTDQLVAGKSFAQIVHAARRNFDHIILDTPPVESAVDSLYLAQHADMLVFVVRWAKTPQRLVQTVIGRLKSIMRPQTGVLVALNQQQSRRAVAKSGSGADTD